MPSPKDYKAIALWGRQLGSFQYYIDGQQHMAADQEAPTDALYFSDAEGKWVCVSDLKPDHRFRVHYEGIRHD
jgi:hypothetical protein